VNFWRKELVHFKENEMLTRRRFAALSAAATGAAIVAPFMGESIMAESQSTASLEYGVQFYMVRDLIKDLPATLHLIHDAGYTHVESFPMVYDHKASVLKSQIHDAGLKIYSGHFQYETLDAMVDYAAELGLKYMVCPMLPFGQWESLDAFHKAATCFNQVAIKARSAGMEFGYHPHNYEFKPLDHNKRGFDVLMEELDPAVKLELDIYWAAEAGEDPLALMRQVKSRLAMIHIKDRKAGNKYSFSPIDGMNAHNCTEAGYGAIDWQAVLSEAKSLGAELFIVDQDVTDLTVADSLRVNWQYLSKLKV